MAIERKVQKSFWVSRIVAHHANRVGSQAIISPQEDSLGGDIGPHYGERDIALVGNQGHVCQVLRGV